MEKGIIVIGHGSRSIEAQETFQSIVEKLKQKGYNNIKKASMEFDNPDIKTAAKEFFEAGILSIIAVPLFLYKGIHIHEDIPAIIKELELEYVGLNIKLGDVLGDDDLVVDLLEKRLNQALVNYK